MEPSAVMTGTQTHHLSFSDLRRYTDILYEKTGYRFGPKRFGTVRTGILKRMQELGHATLEEYLAYMEIPGNGGEWKIAADFMISGESL